MFTNRFIKYILAISMAVMLMIGCVDPVEEGEALKAELLLPMACDTLYFDSTFHFSLRATSSYGLGKVSMDMHDNFGHHNHGAHETCNMDPVKDPINPFVNDWLFDLPNDSTDYILDTLISLPQPDTGKYDTGDYHFHITITDMDGNSVFTTRDVKILER